METFFKIVNVICGGFLGSAIGASLALAMYGDCSRWNELRFWVVSIPVAASATLLLYFLWRYYDMHKK